MHNFLMLVDLRWPQMTFYFSLLNLVKVMVAWIIICITGDVQRWKRKTSGLFYYESSFIILMTHRCVFACSAKFLSCFYSTHVTLSRVESQLQYCVSLLYTGCIFLYKCCLAWNSFKMTSSWLIIQWVNNLWLITNLKNHILGKF